MCEKRGVSPRVLGRLCRRRRPLAEGLLEREALFACSFGGALASWDDILSAKWNCEATAAKPPLFKRTHNVAHSEREGGEFLAVGAAKWLFGAPTEAEAREPMGLRSRGDGRPMGGAGGGGGGISRRRRCYVRSSSRGGIGSSARRVQARAKPTYST